VISSVAIATSFAAELIAKYCYSIRLFSFCADKPIKASDFSKIADVNG
jgi:hypothetical protein